jgi:hypothetical protein
MRTRWILTGVGVLLALAAGEIAIRSLEDVIPPSSIWPTAEMQLKSAQLSSLEGDPDVVIIGSSTSQSSLDPELMAEIIGQRHIYNAALPFSSLASNRVWLEKVVLAHTKPEIVIIGVLPWASNDDGNLVAESMERAVTAETSKLRGLSALVDNRGVLADFDSRRARNLLLGSALWTESGHFTGYYAIGPIDNHVWEPPSPAENLAPTQERDLRLMVENVRDAGGSPVVLVEPVCCQIATTRGNETYLAWLRDRAASWGVPLWDTFSADWSPDLFADPSHLNRAGTEAYTTYVGELLAGQMLTAENSE